MGVALIATMAVAASWNFNQSNNEVSISDLALENIEALARNESSSDAIIANCYWSEGNQCNYNWNGRPYTSSNMKNKH